MKLQKTDTTNRLNTLTQTKNTGASARSPTPERDVEANEVQREESVHDRQQPIDWQAPSKPTKRRNERDHRDEYDGEEPLQPVGPDLDPHFVAHRANDVVRREQTEKIEER